jgi:hypothetical protein
MNREEKRIIIEQISSEPNESNNEESNYTSFGNGLSQGMTDVKKIGPIVILIIVVLLCWLVC